MIALDLDGIFVDFTRDIFIPAGELLLNRVLPQLHESTYDLRDQLGLSDTEHRRIWESDELCRMLLTASPINHRCELLLDGESHCFITSRGTSGLERNNANLIRMNTRRWVRETLRDHSDIHFVEAREKTNRAMDLGIKQAWEDHPDTALAMAEAGIRVRMPVYGYNSGVYHHRITRIEGWREPTLADLLAS
jgi:uncharacterized HAD superfamily protein